MKLKRHLAAPIVFVLATVGLRLLWPLQYYCSFSGEPLWKLTLERRPPPGTNSSVLFLISSSNPSKLSAGLNGWLSRADGVFVFSAVRNHFLDPQSYSLFRMKTSNEWALLSAKTIFAHRQINLHSDWVVLAEDDTIVLVDQLRYEVRNLDFDEPIVGLLGMQNFEKPRDPPPKPIYLFSRGAFKILGRRIDKGDLGCGLTGSLVECLLDAQFLDLEKDYNGHYKSHVLNRHFSSTEMKDYSSRYGEYDDGFQIIHQLSSSLLSLHNLEVDDIRILDVLLNRVRLWR